MRKFQVRVNGEAFMVEVEEIGAAQPAAALPQAHSAVPSAPTAVTRTSPAPAPSAAAKAKGGAGGGVPSPLPGTVLDLKVAVGDAVKEGQVLLILEAMKMENEIVAPADGKVLELCVTKGQAVSRGEVLVLLG